MKVLMLTPWYPDDQSPNSGIFIRHQAQALSKKGHEVVVISAKVNYGRMGFLSYDLKESQFDRIREFRITVSHSFPLYNQLNFFFIVCRQSLKIAKQFKPDVIHSSIGYPGAFWGWMVSRFTGRPYVFTEHTRVTNNFRSFFHRRTTLSGLARASQLMAVSRKLAGEIKTLTGHEVKVVPNIVDIERFKGVQHSQEVVPQLGFLGGMNTPVKGLDILLKALQGVDRDFILHIGGTGTMIDEYKVLAIQLGLKAKCRFYGFIIPDQLPGFMARLHFFVCASRYETFNISLVEAMASGLPVVCTRCGGPEDFVNETNGILCDKEDPLKLAEALDKMMTKYAGYAPALLKEFARNYAPEKIVLQLEEVYRLAIERPKHT